ncbi:hypothetical protein E3E11_01415 [Oecophyllibacter saccharovorans]|uniref:Uncharacterized protein n=1 Tax=Oecophyllibacter saccharovorans TaxID=2558360 RepID=A0A506UR98_9PROT|nr:hypothetical protein [Oecophyllibacter saccharovorans]QDH14739.1 hypothetical protein E3E11_01415 [Oecophyllibacter saccharovorans]TPW35877.1 hypothetical protein E3202_02835 [Oecophyllibacter saccharovorans]
MNHSDPAPHPIPRPTEPAKASIASLFSGLWLTRNIIWAFAHFTACFVLQISEFFAPLLLVLGIGWSLVPHVVGLASHSLNTASADSQTRDLIAHITTSFPMQVEVSGHVLTPHGLIMDGFLLMALTAFCATVSAWLGRQV